eukprot:4402056-Amphidinium_carterae.2
MNAPSAREPQAYVQLDPHVKDDLTRATSFDPLMPSVHGPAQVIQQRNSEKTTSSAFDVGASWSVTSGVKEGASSISL